MNDRLRDPSVIFPDSCSLRLYAVYLLQSILFQAFDSVLSELEPYIMAEQDFCVKFFHLRVAVTESEVFKDLPLTMILCDAKLTFSLSDSHFWPSVSLFCFSCGSQRIIVDPVILYLQLEDIGQT